MIWLFSDVYYPAVSGIPVTIDFLISLYQSGGHQVGLVTTGQPVPEAARSDRAWFLPTVEDRNYPGEQLGQFSARDLADDLPVAKDDVVIVLTIGGVGLTGLGVARRRGARVVIAHLNDYLRYATYYPTVRTAISVLPKAAYMLAAMRPGIQAGTTDADAAGTYAHAENHHPLVKAVGRLLYSQADRVVALSAKGMHDLTNHVGVPAGKVHLTPSGVNIPREWADAASAGRECSEEGPLKLVYVGRLSPEKGVSPLLLGLRAARDQGVEMTVAIVGAGPDDQALASWSSSLQMADVVTFLGALPRRDLGAVYRAADLMVFPSRTDAQGLVWLEAAVMGLPTLFFDPHISELAPRYPGYALEDVSPRAVANRLSAINRERAALRRVSRQLPAMGRGLLDSYRRRWQEVVSFDGA